MPHYVPIEVSLDTNGILSFQTFHNCSTHGVDRIPQRAVTQAALVKPLQQTALSPDRALNSTRYTHSVHSGWLVGNHFHWPKKNPRHVSHSSGRNGNYGL